MIPTSTVEVPQWTAALRVHLSPLAPESPALRDRSRAPLALRRSKRPRSDHRITGGDTSVRQRRSDSHPIRPSRRCLRSSSGSNPFPNRFRDNSWVLTTRNSSSKTASPTGFESGGSGRQTRVLGRIGLMDAAPDPADCGRTHANTTRVGRYEPGPELELDGVVEPALARALVLAAEAGRWAIVEQIARELKERREGPGAPARRTRLLHQSAGPRR
jgi:hypothetical protein